MPMTLRERFDARWVAEPNTGCWLWGDALSVYGYGHIRHGGRNLLAHRAGWGLYRGDIPEGLVIDHMCRVRSCVNPDHLRVVSPRTNALENSTGWASTNALKKACPKCGGPYRQEPSYNPKRIGLRRTCRPCGNAYRNQWRKAKRLHPVRVCSEKP